MKRGVLRRRESKRAAEENTTRVPGTGERDLMTEFVLEREQVVRALLARVFAFFSDAGNLEALTPGYLRFHIVTPRPIEMRPGVMIDYTLRLHGVKFAWRSEITVWEPPGFAGRLGEGRFVDEQRKGPYRKWVHEHRFVAAGEDRTVVRDRVVYAVPGGALVQRLFVRGKLDEIFGYRGEATRRLVEG